MAPIKCQQIIFKEEKRLPCYILRHVKTEELVLLSEYFDHRRCFFMSLYPIILGVYTLQLNTNKLKTNTKNVGLHFLNRYLNKDHYLVYVLKLLSFLSSSLTNSQPWQVRGRWVPHEITDRDSVYLCACQFSLVNGGTGSCCLISLRLAWWPWQTREVRHVDFISQTPPAGSPSLLYTATGDKTVTVNQKTHARWSVREKKITEMSKGIRIVSRRYKECN